MKRKQDTDGKECGACGLRHDLHNCYYAFPEKAPRDFKLRATKKKEVEGKIQKDKDLEKEIKKLKTAQKEE